MQQFNYWEDYFGDVGTDASKSNELGLLTNMFTIGSIVSMFIVYVPRRLDSGTQPPGLGNSTREKRHWASLADICSSPSITDRWGRRPSIIAGCVLMLLGGFLTAFSNGYGST